MYPISLNASFENWKLFWVRRRHPKFKALALKIWERDNYTCQFCEFHTPNVELEVINHDYNYSHNSIDNLLTACPLCAQCFFLESIGTGSFGGGVLIYLPEMSQNQLNALCMQAFLAIAGKSPQMATAENILRDFRFRSAEIEKTIGDNMSDPARFGLLLLSANLTEDDRDHMLSAVRLLPVASRFISFAQAVLLANPSTSESKP